MWNEPNRSAFALANENAALQPEPASRPWYAVRVRSNSERVAHAHLTGRGLDVFLPTYSVTRKWSDRFKQLDLPLFPGYVFCRLDPRHPLPVLSAPGVVQIVGNGQSPLPVHESEMDAIHTILRSKLSYSPCRLPDSGAVVVIQEGPLAGVEGVYLESRKPCRLIISVRILQRSVAVEIDASWVRARRRSEASY